MKKGLNRTEFAKILAKDIGLDIQTTTDLVNTTFRTLFRELKTHEKIGLAGIGVFETKVRKGSRRRHPQTNEIVVTEDKTTITFQPAKQVKEKFN